MHRQHGVAGGIGRNRHEEMGDSIEHREIDRAIAIEENGEKARLPQCSRLLGAAAGAGHHPPRRYETAGHRQRAPYDVILFGGAVAEVPQEISSQLGEGGRMVAVLRPGAGVGRATVMLRTGGVLAQRVIFDATTPLLPGFVPKPAFVF